MASSNHGFVRGSSLARESRLFEGRFGRMFRSLPPLDLDPGSEAVRKLVESMTTPKVGEDDPERIMAAAEPGGPTPETKPDGEENLKIPAGYTYLGQFIDHDLTFDPASSLQRLNDPEALVDFRTPRFDLDSVYGRGPDDQPYMYHVPRRGETRFFHLGDPLGVPDKTHADPDARDHLRASRNADGIRRALIGDKRNDENVLVAQLHTIVMRFHNRFADEHPELAFEQVQQAVRWHYQWVVLNDYLTKIVGLDMVHSILPHLASGKSIFEDTPKLRHFDWKNDPYLPTEFSAAAFRFGHSMVRPIYRLSRSFEALKASPVGPAKETGRRMIFDTDPTKGLNGFGEPPKKWAIEWDLYFGENTGELSSNRVQPSYKVDTSLVNPLANLPEFDFLPIEANLAYRNILRGFSMRLPCGEDVARAMGLAPIGAEWLVIGKAEDEAGFKSGDAISTFGLGKEKPFTGRTPLWLYVLAEGAKNAIEERDFALGEVGGRIVGETMIGLMLGDKQSFLTQYPGWIPEVGGAALNMAGFIAYATGQSASAKSS
jgi:hypothetical protein